MNDHELDRLLARANPFGDDSVRHLPAGAAASDLLEEIVTTTAPTPELRPNRRRRVIVLVAAAAAIVVALTGVFFPRGNPAAPTSAYAAEVRAIAEANQRLLVDAPGWKVSRVDEFTADLGEMTFAKGNQRLDVFWRPADQYQTYFDDRAHDNTHQPIELLGQAGTIFRYGDTTDFTTILKPKGKNFLEIRTDVGSEAAYRTLIGKLKPVGVEEWLDALPASAVKPADNKKTVDAMLADLPKPDGFDAAGLYQQTVGDRYQVGARVSGAVSCAWLDQWTAAKKSGDKTKVAEAVAAMKTSHNWPILKEMAKDGDYPRILWEFADDIAKDQAPVGYADGLGCK
ncbi:hypothetical protein E0H73_05955 [Kribbella pittospori]|uniref:Uncharacterized protein n=1 Tax=Kribbella pittospori TaxID=722689 RepID=A0A4R0KZ64_9ACTN|nr:hypothetical protein [Kribbella pittospori]TCC66421.1 hypothetical protein E0H73_05955 [Kribbella pittospori]